jgi:hypothetical protein
MSLDTFDSFTTSCKVAIDSFDTWILSIIAKRSFANVNALPKIKFGFFEKYGILLELLPKEALMYVVHNLWMFEVDEGVKVVVKGLCSNLMVRNIKLYPHPLSSYDELILDKQHYLVLPYLNIFLFTKIFHCGFSDSTNPGVKIVVLKNSGYRWCYGESSKEFLDEGSHYEFSHIINDCYPNGIICYSDIYYNIVKHNKYDHFNQYID